LKFARGDGKDGFVDMWFESKDLARFNRARKMAGILTEEEKNGQTKTGAEEKTAGGADKTDAEAAPDGNAQTDAEVKETYTGGARTSVTITDAEKLNQMFAVMDDKAAEVSGVHTAQDGGVVYTAAARVQERGYDREQAPFPRKPLKERLEAARAVAKQRNQAIAAAREKARQAMRGEGR
jgi:pectate lyase